MRTHKNLQKTIREWHNGSGVLIYKSSKSTLIEIDVVINRKTKQLCYCTNGKPVEFDVDFEERED